MGNINNIWYLKDGGGDWASTKCALDDCYSIPYDSELDSDLFLQVDIPEGYWVNEVWLADPEGNRVQELIGITDWKVITGEGINKLIFKVPQYSYACKGIPHEEETCIADLSWEGLPLYHQGLINNYVNGLHNTTIYFLYGGVYYDIDGTLPPGFVKLGPTQFQIPCDIDAGDISWQAYSDVGNGNASWPYTGQIGTGHVTVYTPLNCFRFEIPLHPSEEGGEEATLLSEPFHCPTCEPTLKISSDYCLAKADIFGTFIFDTEGLGDTQYGPLTKAKNDLRIQAVLKQLPSKVSANRNIRCNNFRSKLQQRYKLQGAMPTDFPDYMVNMIESIFSGKKLFIEGEEYVPDSEAIFSERNVAARSMKRLDVELVKCERGLVFDCACVIEPPNCNENPIAYSGIMFIVPAPDLGYGCDRSIWYAGMDPLQISGGVPPYTFSDWYWQISGQGVAPDNSIQVFDDGSPDNFFRRTGPNYEDCDACFSVTCKITDARGCQLLWGNSVDIDDLRCVNGQDGFFDVMQVGPDGIKIFNVQPAGYAEYDVSFDGFNTIVASGVTTDPFVINGLAPGDYAVTLRLKCNPIVDGIYGFIGPIHITI